MILKAKLFISGKIVLETGLAIGGGSSTAEIGGIDANVIKNSDGIPYIPGSSLKGKLRCLLEKSEGLFDIGYKESNNSATSNTDARNKEKTKYINANKFIDNFGNSIENRNLSIEGSRVCRCGKCAVCKLFGTAADAGNTEITRLIVRDSIMSNECIEKMQKRLAPFSRMELDYTESKWENTIDRITSKANPRVIERVPAGSDFNFEIICNILAGDEDLSLIEKLFKAMNLLQDDYIGAHGTRGYGKIMFTIEKMLIKNLEAYKNNTQGVSLITEKIKLEELDIQKAKESISSYL